MTKKPKDNKVGPWAEEKLDALRRGLDYYTTRLKNQPYWQKVYVDAFAGPGLSEVRTRPNDEIEAASPTFQSDMFGGDAGADPVEQEVRFLKGSPRVALELKNPFDSYVLIEKDPKRIAELEAMKAEFGSSRNIDIKAGDANAALLALLAGGFSRRTHRAYVFLDPFGIHVPWSTIEALAKTGAAEVMINFPMGMAINRMLPRSGKVPPGWSISLDTFFGSSDWQDHAYEETEDLLGKRTRKVPGTPTKLLDWYRGRLRDTFGFVSDARLITNTRGGHLYYLIWAGPHEAGLKGADYIMKMKRRM